MFARHHRISSVSPSEHGIIQGRAACVNSCVCFSLAGDAATAAQRAILLDGHNRAFRSFVGANIAATLADLFSVRSGASQLYPHPQLLALRSADVIEARDAHD